LVMELLQGSSLRQILEGGKKLSVSQAAFILCQLLSGLDAAHRAGIVHRDLKPDNIFLVDTGALLPGVKILDFGISRITSLAANEEEYTRLTRTGIVLGTPAYMSPEHARGRTDIDHRSDLFSVGVILYEMVTGVLPFDGMNYNAVLASILTEDPPPPTMRAPEIPPPLEASILRALRRDREARFQDASEMFDELLPFVEDMALGRVIMPKGHNLADFTVRTMPKTELIETEPEEHEPEASGTERARGSRGWKIAAVLVAALLVVGVAGWLLSSLLFDTGEVATGAPVGEPVTPPPRSMIPEQAAELRPDDDIAPDLAGDSGVAAPADGRAGGRADSGVVSIELVGLPSGAQVFLDDALVPSLPLRLERGGSMRTLRIEAEGFRSFRRVIDPTEDQSIEVALQRAATPAVVTKRSRAPRRSIEEGSPSPPPTPPETPTKIPVAPVYRPTFID
jgi:hypothetical protein